MNETEFWSLIESIDVQLVDTDDEDRALASLSKSLENSPAHAITEFQEHLSRFLYQLDGAKYAAHAGSSGHSGDGFLYVRCYVIAKGRQFFERVVVDPIVLGECADKWCEELLYVAASAWESTQGGEFEYEPSVSYETGSNEHQW